MKRLLLALSLLSTVQIFAQSNQFTNPILPGGHPDPSICRVDDTYYIVNSSFEYFPGLPIHKSKDLVNWELVGYGLHRKEQASEIVNLVDVQSDGGIHAPTIRYHDGLYYIITTNVYYNEEAKETDFVNFIITAEDPAGPWSEPYHLEGAPGIDPDIFFDEDGRVWYVGTHSPENPSFPGEGEIWLQEIDLENWKLTGERHFLWRGACGGVWAEGPHMYKRNGMYYLMIAEGGTSYNHAMMIAISDKITGPYLSNERNPILSTRHLSYDNWVHSTGHADLFELPDGRWYMVALGIRGDEKRGSNMGRETFLLPVQWEREPFEWKENRYEWPVCSPETGKVERHYQVPFEDSQQNRNDAFTDNFDATELDLNWNFRRVPRDNTYSLSKRKGYLRVFAGKEISHRGQYSFIGFRQKESDFDYSVRLESNPKVEAGMVLIQKDDNYLKFTLKDNQLMLELVSPEETKVLDSKSVSSNTLILKVQSSNHQYLFSFSEDEGNSYLDFTPIGADRILSRKYTGANLGLFCTSEKGDLKQFADFDWISYHGYQKNIK